MDYLNSKADEKYIVYHYCSVESFLNIVKSNTLWLSDAKYMNDTYEAKWLDKIVAKIIQELKSDNILKVEKFEIEYTKLNHGDSKKYFFISFSEEEDMLSQWRGYADDGRGVAIGFDLKNIHEYDISTSYNSGNGQTKAEISTVGWSKIAYVENTENDIGKKIKNGIMSTLEDSSINNIKDYALFIKESNILFKNPYFKEEKEVRLIYSPDNNIETDPSITICGRDFRYSDGQIIPYNKICFSPNLPIVNIKLGSKCKLKENNIEDFLATYGFPNTNVDRSNSSYQ